MASPTTIGAELAVLVASTADQEVALDPRRKYSLGHDAETNAGVSDENTVYLAVGATATASPAEGLNRFKLLAGRSVTVGPGVDVLHYRTAAGAPTISVTSEWVNPQLR